jgi:PDZ domain-containing protein
MYVESSGGPTKIIGQIAEFRRSGSKMVSGATVGIKSRKENIQLLGPHAQTVVSAQPVFYFIPAKQEADAGVNAGDLILVRLEQKSERRQFEIAAHGAWRSSSGISLTHQVQLLRSEMKTDLYKIAPAAALGRGEYALYLSRGEGMAPYVYDFGVQGAASAVAREEPSSRTADVSELHPVADANAQPRNGPAIPPVFKDASIGAFSDGNPEVRRDGVTLTAVTVGGSADRAGIRAGDVVLAINDHYLFTIGELRDEISHHEPGTKISVRYRRYSTIYDVTLAVGRVQ